MSENTQSDIDPVAAVPVTDEGASVQPEASVGDILRAAREAAGLTQEDIAERFKLRVGQVQAVENNQWEKLSGRTFARGLVRGYAKELHLDPEKLAGRVLPDVLAAEVPIIPPSTPSIQPSQSLPEKPRKDVGVIVLGLAILLVAVLAYFLWPVTQKSVEKNNTGAESPVVIPQSPAEAPVMPPPLPATPGPSETSAQPLTPNVVPLEVAPAQNTTPGPQSAALPPIRLTFMATSWVEVRDRDGRVVFSQTGTPGLQKEVSGQAPFNLHIGNADGVKLEYKGLPVELPRLPNSSTSRVKLD